MEYFTKLSETVNSLAEVFCVCQGHSCQRQCEAGFAYNELLLILLEVLRYKHKKRY